jgi:hypothetical protein
LTKPIAALCDGPGGHIAYLFDARTALYASRYPRHRCRGLIEASGMVRYGNFSPHAVVRPLRYESVTQISNEALNELMAIYKEEFGEEIDHREATEMAHRLLTLYKLLAKPPPREHSVSPSLTQHGEASRQEDHPPIGFRT